MSISAIRLGRDGRKKQDIIGVPDQWNWYKADKYRSLDRIYQFNNNRYAARGSTWNKFLTPVPFTDTHASPIFVKTSLGTWVECAPNTPCVSDLGAQTVPMRTNHVINNTLDSGAGIQLVGSSMLANTPGDSPANDNNAKRATQGNGASDTIGRTGLVCTADTFYTFSQSFKYDASTTWVRIVFSDNVANGWQCWVNLQTKTVGTRSVFGAAVVSTPVISLEANGWFRVEIAGKCTGAVAAGTMAVIAVTGDGANTRAAGTYCLWVPNFEFGLFATPPIITGAVAVPRGGNLQIIPNLGANLTTGVSGYIKFNFLANVPEARVFNFTDSANSDQVQVKRLSDGLAWRMVGVDNGVGIGNRNTNNVVVGQTTLVFAFSGSYGNIRYVGDTPVGPIVPTAWPVMNRLGLSSTGIDTTNNSYNRIQELALQFGAQDQSTFNAMMLKAVA